MCNLKDFDPIMKPPNCCRAGTAAVGGCPTLWVVTAKDADEAFAWMREDNIRRVLVYDEELSQERGTNAWQYKALIDPPWVQPVKIILEKTRDNDNQKWKLHCQSALFAALLFEIDVEEHQPIGNLHFPHPGTPWYGPEDPDFIPKGCNAKPYWHPCSAWKAQKPFHSDLRMIGGSSNAPFPE